MNDYVIYTDSACDVPAERIQDWGVKQIDMTVVFDDDSERFQGSTSEFYDQMKAGRRPKTSAINPDEFCSHFRKDLEEGKDIVYIAFSSGLSTTYNSARIATDLLKSEFPQRTILVVDSLCASIGQGLLVYLAAKKKQSGATPEELVRYLETNRLKVGHWFTVDELEYLKRGGRISPTVAFVGNTIGIKPILSVDQEGRLKNTSKIRGRKASIEHLVKKYISDADPSLDPTVVVAHAGCPEDVLLLSDCLKERCGVEPAWISEIGSTIGAHTGPGMLALTFMGKDR